MALSFPDSFQALEKQDFYVMPEANRKSHRIYKPNIVQNSELILFDVQYIIFGFGLNLELFSKFSNNFQTHFQ